MTLTLTDIDRQLGGTLGRARRSHPDDPARVVLAALTVDRPAGTTDALLRTWLRARGGVRVRSLLADASVWRRLLADAAEHREASSSGGDDRVVLRAARSLVSGLTHALSANEARLLTLLALDVLARRDSPAVSVTRRFDVAAGTTRATTIRAVGSLADRGLLTVAERRTGVPTEVRLRQAAPTTGWTPELGLLVEAILSDDHDNAAYRTLLGARSPALAYWSREVDGRRVGFPVDGWYVTLLDQLGVVRATLPAARTSRARRALREIGFSDDNELFADVLADFETEDVIADRDRAECERSELTAARGASAAESRSAKREAWTALSALGATPKPAPRQQRSTTRLKEWTASVQEIIDVADDAQLPVLLDVLRRALIRAGWDATAREEILMSWFGDPRLVKYAPIAGRVPDEPAAIAQWVGSVRDRVAGKDASAVRAVLVRAGVDPRRAHDMVEDSRLRKIIAAAGRPPFADAGPDAQRAWANAAMGSVTRSAVEPLRDDLRARGWGAAGDAVVDKLAG